MCRGRSEQLRCIAVAQAALANTTANPEQLQRFIETGEMGEARAKFQPYDPGVYEAAMEEYAKSWKQ